MVDNYKLKLPNRMRIHPIFLVSLLNKTKNPETCEEIETMDDEYEVERVIGKIQKTHEQRHRISDRMVIRRKKIRGNRCHAFTVPKNQRV